MIHRSIIFEAIEKKTDNVPLDKILSAIEEKNKPTETTFRNKISGVFGDLKLFLRMMWKTIKSCCCKRSITGVQTNEEEKDDEEGNMAEETDSKSVSIILDSLMKIEQVHTDEMGKLQRANIDVGKSGLDKVLRMEERIRTVRETLQIGGEGAGELNQPKSDGRSPLHLTTERGDKEATEKLLKHGANPNVQDARGNSPLHIACQKKDIQTATCILKYNGRLLTNRDNETPEIGKLIFENSVDGVGKLMDKKAISNRENENRMDDVRKLIDTIVMSKDRKLILDQVLKKGHLLFKLVEKNKPEILSIILEKLGTSDKEFYVNLVRDEKDGDTALHVASSQHKSLECSSALLKAGAKLSTNVIGHPPVIEEFFTEANDDKITPALVDGLVERAKAKPLDKLKALEYLIPKDGTRKVQFEQASGKNFELIDKWAKEKDMDLSGIVSRPADSGTEESGRIFFEFNSDNKLNLLSFPEATQKQLAVRNRKKTCFSVPYLGPILQSWLWEEAEAGRWDSELVSKVLKKDETGVTATIAKLGISLVKIICKIIFSHIYRAFKH